MAHNWDSSKRPRDPSNWKQIREHVISRARGLCEHRDGCNQPGTDVDHILNLAQNGSHEITNLQLLCKWHHKRKTALEASQARGIRPKEARPQAKHPGFL